MPIILPKNMLAWDGQVTLGVFDATTFRLKRRYHNHNTVTNYARSYMAQILAGSATMPLVLPSQMELGTGSGTPAGTDTDLWAPAAATLKPLSNTQVYLTYYAQYVCTWQSSDPITGSWSEIGLKDIANNLWAHAAMNITVNPGEMLVGQWQCQILGD